MTFLHRTRRLAQAIGLDIRRFPHHEAGYRRAKLMSHHGIDHVFDVGASDGRFGLELRRFGYRGRIVSFEPLKTAYSVLSARASVDPLWETLPYALGADAKEVCLQIAGNEGASSSVLPMLGRHLAAAPEAAYVATQVVTQKPLDSLWRDLCSSDSRAFLKIDVQGYERSVLEGATEFLEHCSGVQLELSLVPLYEGAMLYRDAIDEMRHRGFELMLLDPGFTDPLTGQTLQADAVFFRESQHE